MSDKDETKKPETLSISGSGKLQLAKKLEAPGALRSGPSQGRAKTVTVEVRKTRGLNRSTGATGTEAPRPAANVEAAPATNTLQLKPATPKTSTTTNNDNILTNEERQSRIRAILSAEEESRRNAIEAARRSEEEARLAEERRIREEMEAARRAAEEAERGAEIQEADEPADTVVEPSVKPAATKATQEAAVIPVADKASDGRKPIATPITPVQERVNLAKTLKPTKLGVASLDDSERDAKVSKVTRSKKEDPRRNAKLTVIQAMDIEETEQRTRSLASIRRQREKARKNERRETEKVYREVVIPETITVQELANRMTERVVDVVRSLMKLGIMATSAQTIDADTAELVVGEFGHTAKRVAESDVVNILIHDEDREEELKSRPPVVTVMGHVDHGKTSLLDALRKTDVAAREAGGITQHIGAYQIQMASGSRITFLDTPGHEAFTAMRARGAKVTDIVVLVVAADDGIMEQTKEAISHAKAAEVPIIVAINKIDKPDADPQRVKNELMSYDLVPEEFGGDVMVVEVSAKQGINLDKLEETILLQAEILELKANPDALASGTVIESKIDRGRGVVASIIIQRGTVRIGDLMVAGTAYGRVRALNNYNGKPIEEAGPSMPVEILGLDSPPDAGDDFHVVESEKTARDIVEYRQKQIKDRQTAAKLKKMDQLFGAAHLKELNVIIKGDVQGSVEAISASLLKLATDEVTIRVVHSGVGGITESDMILAKATGAIIIGFNVRANNQAKVLADRDKIDVRYYSIIYNVVDDVKAALSGLLSPVMKENILGYVEIRQVFNITKVGKVAGCMVTDGLVRRNAKVRLLRDNVVIHEGTLSTLKRFKEDVREVKAGFECGIAFENYDDIREGDTVEAFEVEEIARTI